MAGAPKDRGVHCGSDRQSGDSVGMQAIDNRVEMAPTLADDCVLLLTGPGRLKVEVSVHW